MAVEHRTLIEAYPVLGLRITAGPLELAGMDDDTLTALANLAADGVHPDDEMPFLVPWTRTEPEEFQRQFLQYHWGVRSQFSPDDWKLDFAVRYEGELVGSQGVITRQFLATRTGETGSWLGRRHQGRGIGKAMRRAFCALLFDHLGFEEITSAAFVDNPASNHVSLAVGYRPNGAVRKPRDGTWVACNEYVLTPDALVRGPELTVTGAEPVRRLIGLE